MRISDHQQKDEGGRDEVKNKRDSDGKINGINNNFVGGIGERQRNKQKEK